MVHFVGAGSGAIDLITVRGAKLLGQADVVIYAGSLVNPGLLQEYCRPECEIHDSARMTLVFRTDSAFLDIFHIQNGVSKSPQEKEGRNQYKGEQVLAFHQRPSARLNIPFPAS